MAAHTDPARDGIEERLEALFMKASRFSDAELRLMRLAWNGGDARERRRIWHKSQAVVRRERREALLDGARSHLTEWVNDYLTATTAEYGTLLTARSGMDTSTVRREALPPLLDAVAAIVAFDGLEEDERRMLYEPVSRVGGIRRPGRGR